MLSDRARLAIEVIDRQIELLDEILRSAPEPSPYNMRFVGAQSLQAFEEWKDETAQLLATRVDQRTAQRFLSSGPGLVPAGGGRPLIQTYQEFYGGSLKAIRDRIQRNPESVLPTSTEPIVSSRSTGKGKVFIGHGRSAVWRDLKDFLQDRLKLPWDEFNRVPVAGITNVTRLSQMLNEAAIAFLVLTAEDEQQDGRLHARMNVVHEAGLFQGRLGFEKAIILLEEGCEEFSNIQGLGQIRFPVGGISAKFEDIRRVLEREELLES